MATECVMPTLSPTMTKGKIRQWEKKCGDTVKSGDVIALIDTDKATMEYEAADDGILHICEEAGDNDIEVGKIIAFILEKGEEVPKMQAITESIQEKQTAASATIKKDSTISDSDNNANNILQQITPKIKASPLARKIAQINNVDLQNIVGTGPGNRIVKSDVINTKTVSRKQSQINVNNVDHGIEYIRNNTQATVHSISSMRSVIASRLVESKQNIPHFYLSIDCKVSKILSIRKELNTVPNTFLSEDEIKKSKITINDFIIRATALAMKKFPVVNSYWTENGIIENNNIDVSIAVAIDGGLITPIIPNADKRPIRSISAKVKELVHKARSGSLQPHEYQGGGLTISNLGMYNIQSFFAIINPPQSGILSIGSCEQKPVVCDGEIKIEHIMNVTLSADHRVIDGALAAEFISLFRSYIENPGTLL